MPTNPPKIFYFLDRDRNDNDRLGKAQYHGSHFYSVSYWTPRTRSWTEPKSISKEEYDDYQRLKIPVDAAWKFAT